MRTILTATSPWSSSERTDPAPDAGREGAAATAADPDERLQTPSGRARRRNRPSGSETRRISSRNQRRLTPSSWTSVWPSWRSAGSDANRAPTQESLTGQGLIMGTVGYMSPGADRGNGDRSPLGHFLVRCVLYEVMAGPGPFEGNSTVDTLHKILHDEPPALNVTANTPIDLHRVIRRCLAKDRNERYQSMKRGSRSSCVRFRDP